MCIVASVPYTASVRASRSSMNAQRVIELRIRQHDGLDGNVANARTAHGAGPGEPRQLVAHIGRRIDQEPLDAVRADGDGRLRPGVDASGIGAGGAAGGAPAVPLGDGAPGGGAEKNDLHGEGGDRLAATP